GRSTAHGETGDEAALQQHVRIVAQDVAILAGARFGLIGVDDEIGGPVRIRLLGHEGSFQAGRKSGPAAPAQVGFLDLVDDGVASALDQSLGVVPNAPRPRTRQVPVLGAIEIAEDAIDVLQHLRLCAYFASSSVVGPLSGAEPWRPVWEPAGTGLPRASPSST